MIKDSFPGVNLISNESNFGFALANNQAIERILELDYEFVLMVNNDLRLGERAIELLESTLDDFPAAGSTAPVIYYPDGHTVWFAGASVNFRGASVPHILKVKDRFPYESEALNAACLLTRSSVLRRVGLFDVDFFAYFEDADLTLRMRGDGYLLLIQPAAKCTHEVSKSLGEGSPRQYYYYYRNRLYFCHKNAPPAEFRRATCTVLLDLIRLFWQAVRPLIRLRCHRARWTRARWAVRGVLAFRKGYVGEIPQ